MPTEPSSLEPDPGQGRRPPRLGDAAPMLSVPDRQRSVAAIDAATGIGRPVPSQRLAALRRAGPVAQRLAAAGGRSVGTGTPMPARPAATPVSNHLPHSFARPS